MGAAKVSTGTQLAIVGGVFGLTALAAAVGGAMFMDDATEPDPGPLPKPQGGWSDPGAPARIRAIAAPIEAATGLQHLGDYLVAVAWTESRGNPNAQYNSSTSSARSWFGMRPNTALAHDLAGLKDRPFEGGQPGNIYKNEALSVALATWLMWRLRNYKSPGQKLDRLAIRRGWALPRLVSDVDETASVKGYADGDRSKDVRRRFSQGVAKAGLPQSFMFGNPYEGLGKWPGIWTVMDLAGVDYAGLGITRGGAQA